MKKSLIITFFLVSLVCQAQEEQPNFWHRPFWHNLTSSFITLNDNVAVGNIDFLLQCYTSLGMSELRQPILKAMHLLRDLQQPQPLAGWADQYTPEYGNSFFEHFVNEPTFSFGLEATLHVLPLLYKLKTPFDLTLSGRVGKNPRDLDLGLGIGLGYCPIERLKLYARTYYGAFGFPNGGLETGFHYHLVASACYRLGK